MIISDNQDYDSIMMHDGLQSYIVEKKVVNSTKTFYFLRKD